jgi:hypothetical protein
MNAQQTQHYQQPISDICAAFVGKGTPKMKLQISLQNQAFQSQPICSQQSAKASKGKKWIAALSSLI